MYLTFVLSIIYFFGFDVYSRIKYRNLSSDALVGELSALLQNEKNSHKIPQKFLSKYGIKISKLIFDAIVQLDYDGLQLKVNGLINTIPLYAKKYVQFIFLSFAVFEFYKSSFYQNICDYVKIILLSEEDKNSALIENIYSNKIDEIKLLIDCGANIEVENRFGYTPLMIAIYYDKPAIVKFLIAKGGNIEAKDKYGYTPLMITAFYGMVDFMRVLLDSGVNLEAKDKNGNTALMMGVHFGVIEVVRILINNGGNIEAKDNDNYALSMVAAYSGRADIMKLLIDQGVNIEAHNDYGYTPLLIAVCHGRVDVVKLLIAEGANIGAKLINGETALELAMREGNADIIGLLINAEKFSDEMLVSELPSEIIDISGSYPDGELILGGDDMFLTPEAL